MKKILLILSVFLLSSCATTMPGKKLNVNSTTIEISLAENTELSSGGIKMFQIYVMNLSSDWVSIDSVVMGSASTAKVLVGDKMSAWIEACTLENKVNNYNINLALGSIAIAGAVVAGTSDNKMASDIGLASALGAVSVSGVRDFMNSKNKVDFQSIFPEGHLFRPFIVPPKKVLQRWILVENPKSEDLVVTLQSKTKGVSEVSFMLN